ncbi:MAG: response regulator, partial [Verrucomicrobiales bacterium]
AGYVTKPVIPSRLLDLLERILGNGAGQASDPTAEPGEKSGLGSSQAGRILIAEDNQINQAVAKKMVGRMGFQVDVVATGKEALEAVSGKRYDLVLMDCQMPELDGYAATEQIRLMANPTSQIPIIALTAGAMDENRERCREAGMNDFIAKPIDRPRLETIIRRWIAS